MSDTFIRDLERILGMMDDWLDYAICGEQSQTRKALKHLLSDKTDCENRVSSQLVRIVQTKQKLFSTFSYNIRRLLNFIRLAKECRQRLTSSINVLQMIDDLRHMDLSESFDHTIHSMTRQSLWSPENDTTVQHLLNILHHYFRQLLCGFRDIGIDFDNVLKWTKDGLLEAFLPKVRHFFFLFQFCFSSFYFSKTQKYIRGLLMMAWNYYLELLSFTINVLFISSKAKTKKKQKMAVKSCVMECILKKCSLQK